MAGKAFPAFPGADESHKQNQVLILAHDIKAIPRQEQVMAGEMPLKTWLGKPEFQRFQRD